MAGTDLPSTRAPRPFAEGDLLLVLEALGEETAKKVFYDNAVALYRPTRVQVSGRRLPAAPQGACCQN